MNFFPVPLEREKTADFSRSNYEVIFSVFMVALAYFYRYNPLISYPEALYLFMSLLAANFAFNRIFLESRNVSLWLVDVMLASNIGIITAILAKSGGHLSYFWVLYLLPIFTGALTGRIPEDAGSAALCVLALATFSADAMRSETVQLLSFLVKFAVFIFSAFVIYRSTLARRLVEDEIARKRTQVEKLLAEVSRRDLHDREERGAAEVGLMAGLLHDLGNVISVIQLSAEVMAQEDPPDRNDARRVERAASAARSIINGALALVKGDGYDLRPMHIKVPAGNAAAIFMAQARGKGVTIKLEIEEDLPKVKISSVHIQRVFMNALANSLSFLKEGGGITVKASRAGSAVLAAIEDDGPGFPEAVLELGIRAFGSTRKENGGTGLGLFNAKEIIEEHGGKLSLRNKNPSGAVVEFTLPAAAED